MEPYPGFNFFVVKFWKLPYKRIDELVCIPSSWILRRATNKKVLVAYPIEHSKHTERRVKQRQRLSETWRGYAADVKYSTDSYVDAQNFIKKQKEYKCPNAEKNRGPELSGKKEAQESKREYNLNHKTAIPEEFVVLKNDESATKIRLRRLQLLKARRSVNTKSNVATLDSIESTDSEVELSSSEASESSSKNHTLDSIESTESDSEVELSSSEASESSSQNHTLDSIESTESDSEVEMSSSEAFESTSKNHLSTLYEEFMIENFNNDNCVEKVTNFETDIDKTQCDIRNLSNLANQSLDHITINKKEFLTGFFKFVRENPEKAKEALKLLIPNNNIQTASISKETTADMTKISGSTRNVENEIIIDEVGNEEDTSKYTTSEITNIISGSTRNVENEIIIDEVGNEEDTSKDTTSEITNIISGITRNVEKKQYVYISDDGDKEEQVQNKDRCHEQKFILPPEYDENNSRWTLKYHKSAPELVELIPHTGVYVNAVKLSNCMTLAKDCNTLTKNLMLEIFKESALSTCSLTGKKGKGYNSFGVRPGLNKKATVVLIAFVKEYGRKKGWQMNTQTIQDKIRNTLRYMRRKQK